MTQSDRRRQVLGFVGGTGPQGQGLALRFARAGHPVLIGSRNADKAKDVVSSLDVDGLDMRGVTNVDACVQAEVLFVTLPYAAQRTALADLADAIGEKIVVSCVNAIDRDERGPLPGHVPAGSAAQECAQLLPRARIVSAFHHVSTRRLLRIDEPVTVDVLICGDDEDAKHVVAHLAAEIPGMWGVDCGPLRLSGPVEHMTPVLISINGRYKLQSGLRIDGLTRGESGPPPA
ncbi:MAG: NADPH-dependent F420 reductase [Egibacteraceae bacterium]